ncbi:hypothetical protein [Methylocaldum sp. GT1TLB]|jgi:hypothetical protein|uniref:hypothetical protein n=1 Tax=Methylocaldum sp. GT1TLB TaxID=3438965 RepID=UPI003DA09AD3
MNEIVFFGIEAALVAALPVAFVVTRLFAKHAPQHTRSLLIGSVIFLATIAVLWLAGVSMLWMEADVFVLFTASVFYSSMFLLAFRIKRIAPRIVAVAVLGSPILLGYVAGTVGVLGVLFISGDLGSSVELNTKTGLLCRAEPFGNATTDVNGYFARLVRPIGFLERNVFEARFVDPITPEEACSRASAAYGS